MRGCPDTAVCVPSPPNLAVPTANLDLLHRLQNKESMGVQWESFLPGSSYCDTYDSSKSRISSCKACGSCLDSGEEKGLLYLQRRGDSASSFSLWATAGAPPPVPSPTTRKSQNIHKTLVYICWYLGCHLIPNDPPNVSVQS